jgi:hypothetical protein
MYEFEIIKREVTPETRGVQMIKKSAGRPPKLTYKTMIKLADAIQHNATISEACRYAGISTTAYFSYMNNEVFAEKMKIAKENRNKVVFSFCTYF